MNKILLLLLTAMIFTGCQVSYVRPSKGDMAGTINVYQGFSRSAVGAQNTVDADVTKTSEMLTADISPELSSEINPELNSAYDLDLSSEVNPAFASEINPELDTNINAEISDIYKSETAPEVKEEPVEEEEVTE